jgi:hypothetical protein
MSCGSGRTDGRRANRERLVWFEQLRAQIAAIPRAHRQEGRAHSPAEEGDTRRLLPRAVDPLHDRLLDSAPIAWLSSRLGTPARADAQRAAALAGGVVPF